MVKMKAGVVVFDELREVDVFFAHNVAPVVQSNHNVLLRQLPIQQVHAVQFAGTATPENQGIQEA